MKSSDLKLYDDQELMYEAWDLLRDLEEKFAEIDLLRPHLRAVVKELNDRV